MKFVTFARDGAPGLGVMLGDHSILDLKRAGGEAEPTTAQNFEDLISVIEAGDAAIGAIAQLLTGALSGKYRGSICEISDVVACQIEGIGSLENCIG